MKKLLLVSALCALLVPTVSFAALLGSPNFTNMSGRVANLGASYTIITTNGTTSRTVTSTRLTGGIDHAILGAVTTDGNFNQEFVDTIIFKQGTLKVRGTLLANTHKASGPASFLLTTGTQFITGAADVKIVGPNAKKVFTVQMTLLPNRAGFGNGTGVTSFSTLDGGVKLPAMLKKTTITNYSSTLF
ncbi:MAG: hypothetical protein WA666_06965 [Nitrospirota bacterium]